MSIVGLGNSVSILSIYFFHISNRSNVIHVRNNNSTLVYQCAKKITQLNKKEGQKQLYTDKSCYLYTVNRDGKGGKTRGGRGTWSGRGKVRKGREE